MENSTVRRGLVVLVLVTCSMLLLWWFAPKAADPGPTPTAELTRNETAP
jgi:hypothetical protein